MKLIKPAWNETLQFLAGIQRRENTAELIGILVEDYFATKERYLPKEYNPYLDDLCSAAALVKERMDVSELNYEPIERTMDELIKRTKEAIRAYLETDEPVTISEEFVGVQQIEV